MSYWVVVHPLRRKTRTSLKTGMRELCYDATDRPDSPVVTFVVTFFGYQNLFAFASSLPGLRQLCHNRVVDG